MTLTTWIKSLSIPEKNGKKIGLFRVLSSIFGGLFVSYLGMTLLIYIIPGTPGESIIIPLMFNTLVWAICSLWIAVSPTKMSALKRACLPSLLFLIILIILF